MARFLSKISLPTALLCIFMVATQIIGGFYIARGIELPPAYVLLNALGFIWITGWWLQRDSRAHGVKWVLDMGLFLYLTWPFSMLYYLFKTRGSRAFLIILAFLGIYAGASALGSFVYLLLSM